MVSAELFRNRFARLEGNLRDRYPEAEELAFVAVFCNGCGHKVVATDLNELLTLTEGWSLASEFGGEDLCPRCR
jgi:hypothetical protein